VVGTEFGPVLDTTSLPSPAGLEYNNPVIPRTTAPAPALTQANPLTTNGETPMERTRVSDEVKRVLTCDGQSRILSIKKYTRSISTFLLT